MSGLMVLAVLALAIGSACSKTRQPNAPAAPAASADGIVEGVPTATGKLITPTAAKGTIFQQLNPRIAAAPDHRVSGAAAVAVAPNGRRLAIMTSGFAAYFDKKGTLVPEASTEFVFIFDITGREPKQLQALSVPHTFQGLAWAPTSDRLFVSGGMDDTVVAFVERGGTFVPDRTIALGHRDCIAARPDPNCRPITGGLAVRPDGQRLLVANLQNDSVSLVDLKAGRVAAEQDLRPGIIDPKRRGEPGGSFPRAVAWVSNDRAYVASVRDREIISLAVSANKMRVVRRLPVQGQPAALLTNKSGSRLYVALDTTNQVAVVDTKQDAQLEQIDTVAPASVYDNKDLLGGANSNALTLTPDERTLLVSNGGQNSIAVVRLSAHASDHDDDDDGDDDDEGGEEEEEGLVRSATIGLVPTGWYPTGVATSHDGGTWYVVNGKSPMGPNNAWCAEVAPGGGYCDPGMVASSMPWTFAGNGIAQMLARNVHVNQLEKAGFLSMPAPNTPELARLTKQVARNNGFDRPDKTAGDERLFAFLRQRIKHVIYIVKENRTYDQILGDLEVGNGDPRLTFFPESISPNHHAIARNFVTLDNFLVSGEGSLQGMEWSLAAQTNDMRERQDPVTLSNSYKGEKEGFDYDTARFANTAFPTAKERHAIDPSHSADPDILPGTNLVFGADGPGGEAGAGYIFDAALRGGRTVRNYCYFSLPSTKPPDREPRVTKRTILPMRYQSLLPYTDLYCPAGWVPDFWRVREWQYEFAEFVKKGSAPNLMMVRLPMNHLGNFDTSLDGVDTPETQMADNDYAVGLLLETVAKSPFAKNTIVITIEDDASDGADHVDAQRSVLLIAGPYVRQRVVLSKRYTTVNVVKTIQELLGIGPIGLNDALAAPMSELFDPAAAEWSYMAIVPDVLRSTRLPLPPTDRVVTAKPKHPASYWTRMMAGLDFSDFDRHELAPFNHALWRGFRGDAPYPVREAR